MLALHFYLRINPLRLGGAAQSIGAFFWYEGWELIYAARRVFCCNLPERLFFCCVGQLSKDHVTLREVSLCSEDVTHWKLRSTLSSSEMNS